MNKKLWSILLALCLVLSLLPLSALAVESAPAGGVLRQPEPEAEIVFHESGSSGRSVKKLQASAASGVCYTVEEAAAVLREGMKQRESSITFTYVNAEKLTRDTLKAIYQEALAHTGVPTEGDYLRWQVGRNTSTASMSSSGGVYTATVTYTFESFHDTLAQEQETDAAVAEIVSSLQGKSDYEIVEGIYDYLGETVTYDDAAAAIPSDQVTDHTPWTAYGALVKHQAVCQGYALAFYRLALELGIDARIVTGIGAGGDHAWIAAELDGLYYYLDPTWGGDKNFLKGTNDFEDHYPEDSSVEFLQDMWLSETSYAPSTIVANGTCGDNLTWRLLSNGVLFIEGEGEMEDYEYVSPWEEYDITYAIFKTGVTSIGDSAFRLLDALKDVSISDTVLRIGDHSFSGCSSLARVSIPNRVTSIGECAFGSCSSLSNAIIPDSVTTIGEDAFNGCSSLSNIIIPDSVTNIERAAFAFCNNLTNVVIPAGVTAIKEATFYECENLNSVTIPKGVTSIETYAFYNCVSLSSVTIPDSVSSIADRAFADCYSLTEFIVDPENPTYQSVDGVIFSKDGTELICCPCGIYGDYVIPDSVTTIAKYAFLYCEGLKSIVVPDCVTSISTSAFDQCYNLTDVYYTGSSDQWNRISIGDNNDPLLNATFHYLGELAITAQPVDYVGKVNSTAAFSVEATGVGLSYQWQFSDNGGKKWTNSSARTPEYSTKLTAARDGRLVRCIVTDQSGESVISDAAAMRVYQLSITKQPVDQAANVNASVSFSVEAQGEGLSYQWQISDNGGAKWSKSSVTSDTYSTKLTAARDGRLVRCVVTDQYGNSVISDAAAMRVYQLAITKQPVDQVGNLNATVTFTVEAQGEGLSYQWQFSDNGGKKWSKSSVIASVYSAKLTAAKDGRLVRCIVTDKYGNSVTTEPASMTLGGFRITEQPQNYVGKLGSAVTFTIQAAGDGLTYQWQFSDNNGGKWTKSSETSAVYTTKLTSARDGRLVRCVVTDQTGKTLTSDVVSMKIG